MSTATLSVTEAKWVDKPRFSIVKDLPPWLAPQLETAVRDFMDSSNVASGVNKAGFYNQTLESIANATVLGAGGEFWIGQQDHELLIYLIAHVMREVDGRLCYWISQCWVRKDHRGQPIVKEWWQTIRARAKQLMCSHIVVVSSRGTDAYCRFLGPGWHHYADLLKEDI